MLDTLNIRKEQHLYCLLSAGGPGSLLSLLPMYVLRWNTANGLRSGARAAAGGGRSGTPVGYSCTLSIFAGTKRRFETYTLAKVTVRRDKSPRRPWRPSGFFPPRMGPVSLWIHIARGGGRGGRGQIGWRPRARNQRARASPRRLMPRHQPPIESARRPSTSTLARAYMMYYMYRFIQLRPRPSTTFIASSACLYDSGGKCGRAHAHATRTGVGAGPHISRHKGP